MVQRNAASTNEQQINTVRQLQQTGYFLSLRIRNFPFLLRRKPFCGITQMIDAANIDALKDHRENYFCMPLLMSIARELNEIGFIAILNPGTDYGVLWLDLPRSGLWSDPLGNLRKHSVPKSIKTPKKRLESSQKSNSVSRYMFQETAAVDSTITVVYERLPSQAGVQFLNALPDSIKDAPTPKALKTRIKRFLVSQAFYNAEDRPSSSKWVALAMNDRCMIVKIRNAFCTPPSHHRPYRLVALRDSAPQLPAVSRSDHAVRNDKRAFTRDRYSTTEMDIPF
ncbi:hypothetical protein J6590_050890 [Homalodisca vitripennis]|nr:hypothetical protein J6590_050890 [Homalodisca vitripennis]